MKSPGTATRVAPARAPQLEEMPQQQGRPSTAKKINRTIFFKNPGKNTGVGCHALLQGIFPTLGSNLHHFTSPALAGGSLPLMPLGKPRDEG